MGSGKSTAARRLAAQLGRPLFDMDAELERRFGQPIAQVFAGEGEAAFRRAEAALCRELATPRGLVVACGGGAVVDPANRAALSTGGVLILLTATPAALFARIEAAGEVPARPMLRGADPEAALAALLAARAPAYEAIPLQIDTTHQTPIQVATAVLSLYNQAVADRQAYEEPPLILPRPEGEGWGEGESAGAAGSHERDPPSPRLSPSGRGSTA
jgi:shikimate kinase